MTVAVAAVDLGASSGRVVLGHVAPGLLRIEAVARFTNEPVQLPDGLHWDVVALYARALAGLQVAGRTAGSELVGLAIDSWAVDYGLVRAASLLGTPFHYRDERTIRGVERVHTVVPHEELYRRNGLQFLTFNTLYQLAADPWLQDAERMLLVPDLLSWWLSGEMVTERHECLDDRPPRCAHGHLGHRLGAAAGYSRRSAGPAGGAGHGHRQASSRGGGSRSAHRASL